MFSKDTCYLSEIYSAIQGEGPLVGVRQIFVRFSVCDLRCVWCDTPESLIKSDFCQVETSTGKRDFKKIKNPVTKNDLISYIQKLNPELHHSISLTGGEALLQAEFLREFLLEFKKQFQTPIYLETGGHRYAELEKVIDLIDFISMDFKLPSSAKMPILWDKHLKFLEVSSKSRKNIWVKIVLTKDTLISELEHSINLVKSFNKNIEVILQPVTEINSSKPPSKLDLLKIHSRLLKLSPNIRVIPQVHKLVGQL